MEYLSLEYRILSFVSHQINNKNNKNYQKKNKPGHFYYDLSRILLTFLPVFNPERQFRAI